MPKTDDPIVYRYTGRADDGEALTGIPGRSLRQSDVDAMTPDAKAELKAHLAGDHRHIFSEVEAAAPAETSSKAVKKDGA